MTLDVGIPEQLSDHASEWPHTWGEGALFAFSGVDGETDALSGFVATLGSEPFDLLWHTPRQRRLRLRLPGAADIRLLTGDALAAQTAAGPLTLAFSAWHTLLGKTPPGAVVELLGPDGAVPDDGCPGPRIDRDPGGRDAMVLCREHERFALAFGRSVAEAETRARGTRAAYRAAGRSAAEVLCLNAAAARSRPRPAAEEMQRRHEGQYPLRAGAVPAAVVNARPRAAP